MKKETLWMRIALIMVVGALAVITILLATQMMTSQDLDGLAWQGYLMLLAMLAMTLSMGGVAFLSHGLLTLVDHQQIFSQKALDKLIQLQRMMLIVCLTALLILPMFYHAADVDDAPGLMLLGLSLAFLPWAAYTLLSVLGYLLRKAIALQLELSFIV